MNSSSHNLVHAGQSKLFFAAIALTVAGCAATTAKIEPARLNELQKGKTTVDEVVRQFGRPSLISRNPDGTQTVTYFFSSDSNPDDAIVTLIATTPRNSTVFYFDTKGALADYKVTEALKTAPATQPATAGTGKPAVERAEAAPSGATPAAQSSQTQPEPVTPPAPRKPAPIYNDRFPGSTVENR